MQLHRHSTTMAFPTPIIAYQLNPCDELNASLEKDIGVLRRHSDGLRRSNVQGWHSAKDLFRRQEESFVRLCKAIRSAALDCTQRLIPGFTLETQLMTCEGWININGRGGMNRPHKHPGSFWSGCYYVAVPRSDDKRSGALQFQDPRARDGFNLANSTVFGSELRFNPRAGAMVFFPSYAPHWVYPNQEDDERISIAFNVAFIPRVKSKVEENAKPGTSG